MNIGSQKTADELFSEVANLIMNGISSMSDKDKHAFLMSLALTLIKFSICHADEHLAHVMKDKVIEDIMSMIPEIGVCLQ